MMDEVWDLGMLELKSSKARRGSSQKMKIKKKRQYMGGNALQWSLE